MAIGTSTFKLPPGSKQKIDEYGEEFKAGWQKRKESARGSVISLFKNVRGDKSKRVMDHDEERLGPRPVSRKTMAPSKSSVPVFDISDDVLDRLVINASTRAKKPTQDFLTNQRRRAQLGHQHSASTPLAAMSQAEQDRQPLDAEDVLNMFAGAPYFDVDEVGGHPQPKVMLGWDPSVSSDQDLTDYEPFKHKSFFACTTEERTADADLSMSRKRRRLPPRERPSMLARQGKDIGTVGFSHFLELPLKHEEITHTAIANQQHLLIDPSSLGLRDFDIENALDRLSELSKVYENLSSGKGEAADWNQQMIEEIGEDLFSTLLDDDLGTTAAGTGSVSLRTQITALQKVLSAEHLWYDFALEHWRAQFGRMLWDPNETEVQEEQWLNERDVLLFQIALSAELAVRLELASRLSRSDLQQTTIFAPDDLEVIVSGQTETLDWDILLFQRFAQCFDISLRQHGARSPLRRLSFVDGGEQTYDESTGDQEPDLVLSLRKEREQWDGLHTFATLLNWPDSSKIQTIPKFDSFLTPPVQERPASYGSEYGTPLSTPRTSASPHTQQTPAFIFLRSQRTLVTHSAISELTNDSEPLSWMSLSWLSGTIMPGRSSPLYLMRMLLETTPNASRLLSEVPDLHEGFVYKHQMYWSKTSVVGRVLAPTPDAKECMGWVSVPFVPQDQGDGWMQPYVLDAPYAAIEPRLLLHDLIATSSDPLHGHDASHLQAGDFSTPVDGHMVMGNEAQLRGVTLTASQVIQRTPDGFILPKTVNVTFRSPKNHKMQPLTLPLTHDVQFVSSFPCYPFTKRRRGTAHGINEAHDSAAPSANGDNSPLLSPHNKDLPSLPAHPLYTSFTQTIIPAAALLSSELPGVKDSDSLILMDSAADHNPSTYQIEDQEVIVLDCRGSAELEVLARAWCSKVGENALVSKSGRTCLACCIREAIGLGMGVVIRT